MPTLPAKSPEYAIWTAIRQRCLNPKATGYKPDTPFDPRWQDFATFFSDMGERPSPEHRLVRVRVERGFTPRNCVWALPGEVRSRRNANAATYEGFGETKTLADWAVDERCKEKKISLNTLRHRVQRLGWPVEKAVSLSPRRGPGSSQRLTVAEIAERAKRMIEENDALIRNS